MTTNESKGRPLNKTPFTARESHEFETFYAAFPRREARADAWKAWQQTRTARPPLQALLHAVEAAANANEWTASRRRFIPLPASWLRGERWADEFDVPTRAKILPPPPDPADVERRERERIQVMRARGAWADVVQALVQRSMPLGGWPDARTAGVLDRIGGFACIGRARTRAELQQHGLAFERAWLDAAEFNHAGARLQLARG